MRIVYVLNSLGIGGAERQALAIADRMFLRGHAVAILVLGPRLIDEWPTTLSVIHLDMDKTPANVLGAVVKARRFLRAFRPHLIHSHSFHANIFARLFKPLIPSAGILSTVHNVYEGGWQRMLVYRLTDGLANRTTTVSQAAADRFVRLRAVPRHRCFVLPNGIDIAEFAPDEDRRALMRETMGAGESFIWIAAGRMVPAKDYPNLMRAFKQVRAALPSTQLWIAGAGADATQKRIADGRKVLLSGFSVEHGSMENVRLLGLRRDMPALLDAADAFVLSSAWEGMPLVVGEAMAMEKPVVATDAGGTHELVGSAGTIVPVADSSALAAAMLNLMQLSDQARQSQGRAARDRIASCFTFEARADKWEALYRSIIETRN